MGQWSREAGEEPALPSTYRFHNSENVSWLRGGSMVSSDCGSCIAVPGNGVWPLGRAKWGFQVRHTQPRDPQP